MSEWIPVTERLPEEKREVLICTSDEFIYIGEYEKWTWADGLGTWTESVEYRTISDVVAWMPLPEPWKGEEDESNVWFCADRDRFYAGR